MMRKLLGTDEKVLKERLRFELMLSDISARLMAAPFEQVDFEIEHALKEIKDFFEVDLCAMLEGIENRHLGRVTHAVYGEGIEPIPPETNLAELYPWTFGKLMSGELINISSPADYPEEALMDKQSSRAMGTLSRLVFPVDAGGGIKRIITLHQRHREQSWPEEYIPRLRLLGAIIVNSLERGQVKQKLDEQLGFEKLLSDISARFINLPADQVDGEIVDAQRRICECLGLDLSSFWQWSMETPRIATMTHVYRVIDDPPLPEPMYAHEVFPWCKDEMEAGRKIILTSIEDAPAEAARDKEMWHYIRIKSALVIPLAPGGGPIAGTLSFCSVASERTWPEALVQRLELLAQVFTNALARKQVDTALRESEARLSMTTEAVGAGLWIMDVGTKKVWGSQKSRELFQFAPDEEITYESYFTKIHPEDRDRVDQDVRQSLRSGEAIHCDYRVVLQDGSIRWLVSRGQVYLKPTGEPDRVMGLTLDITERKGLELQLSESQTLLSALVNSTSDLIWSVDPERFGLLMFNRGLHEYFLHGIGLRIEPGMNPDELLPAEYARKWYEFYRRALEEGTFTTDYQAYAGGRTLRLNVNTLRREGEVFGISVFGQDVTERKKMEEQLSESQTLLTSLINSTSDMIWSVDAERFGLLTFNNGLSRYFLDQRGIRINPGDRPVDLFPTEDYIQQWHTFYRRALEDGSFTTEYQAYSGTRTLRLNINKLISEGRVFGASVFAQDITERKQMESQLQERLAEIERLKERLEKENVYLREETKLLFGQNEIVGDSKPMRSVLAQAGKVAATDSTVLILGETGTGKELVARAIHNMSKRKDRTLVTVNCASLPPNLIESELFGREKGAYTGALTRMVGRFETADGSTLFLDEIGEMPFEVQSKLLRVLEQGVFERLGSTRSVRVDVRIIAATNRDLSSAISEGKFRKDLYYRLNVFPIHIPPLRDRSEDIVALVWSFIKQFEKTIGKRITSISKKSEEALVRYGWPGNVRELRNVIEHAMILSTSRTLEVFLPDAAAEMNAGTASLEDMERRHILETLEKTNWRISGRNGASEILGMKRTTLQSKMKALGISRPTTS